MPELGSRRQRAPGERLRRLLPLRPGEAVPVLLACAYGFAILFAYYLLRPVRDEIGAADRGNLQLLWTAVFLVMLVAVPVYSIAAARWPRARLIAVANRFFASHLIAFYAALMLLPESARPWIDRVFYVWLSVFVLFVVTVYWAFIDDLFRSGQGRRLFGLIAVGSSLGGIAGSAVTALLADLVPVFALLLAAAVPLEIAAWLAGALDARARRQPHVVARAPAAPIGGSAWEGFTLALRSRRLRTIAGWLLLMTFASAMLYFVQAHLIGEAIADRAARRAFLARLDLAVNLLTIATQTFVSGHLLRRLGLRAGLALLPAVALGGLALLAAQPTLAVLAPVRVLYDSSRHALAKPAREVLFTEVGRAARYKAKAFIDTAVYRGGDLASGWVYASFAAAGLTVAGIALAALPAAGLWLLIGWQLGGAGDRDAGEASPVAPGATSPGASGH